MDMPKKPSVEITYLPFRYQAYFDWLLTGLGVLGQQGKLDLKFREPTWQKSLGFTVFGKSPWRRFMPHLWDQVSPLDYFCMTGRLRVHDRVVSFVVDVADSPFNFALAMLETADLYFKCQCPITFDPQGFPLNSQVRIPYHPDVLTFAHKIRPGMLGRPLARTTRLTANLRSLRQWEATFTPKKATRIFAFFGSSSSPEAWIPGSPLQSPYNYEGEAALLARWGTQIHHPNCKRARLVQVLRGLGRPGIDARVCRTDNPAIQGPWLDTVDYQAALQSAAINVNISGLRRSVPFRFIDTFLCGGMVATDSLAVRWYAPFEAGVEVAKIGDLGYEPEDRVDWDLVRERLIDLSESPGPNPEAIRDAYQRKWSPVAFANYFLRECRKVLELQR